MNNAFSNAPGREPGTDPSYAYVIESVENAVKTLMMLRDSSTIRAIDVAGELGVARSTAHRMVSTLTQLQFLERDPGRRSYTAGPSLLELSRAVLNSSDIRPVIQPVLARLAVDSGETTQFLVLDGNDVYFTAAAEGTHVVRAVSRLGSRLPAHITAAGKCLLAQLPEEVLLRRYQPRQKMSGGTDLAYSTLEELRYALIGVATQGFATNCCESEPGLFGVSVPVSDSENQALGAITISGPVERVQPQLESFLDMLRSAAEELRLKLSRPR